MKIIVVHTDPFPSPMAGSVFSLSSAVGFAQAGHKTTLLMPDRGISVEDGVKYYGISIPKNLSIKLPARQDLGAGPFRFTYTKKYYRAVEDYLAKEKDADGIIVRTLKLAAYLVEKKLPAPLFYEAHDWYGDIGQKWYGAEWMISKKKLKREKALRAVQRRTLPKVTGILALRKTTAALFLREYENVPVVVAPTGVIPPEPFPEVSTRPIVVYLGQLHPHKGLDLLFDVAVIAKDLGFLIIGGGPWLAHWKKRAVKKGIDKRVEFTGHLKKADVPKALAKGRVGVLPLLDCFFNRRLTSPLKIMEYYSAGLPVVTARGPVTSEVVIHEKTGLLAGFGNAGDFAKCLNRLCLDNDLFALCRKNIKENLKELTWAKRARTITEFISRLDKN